MSDGRFFCSAASRSSGEQMYGTVARIDSWLLIEYPGAWRPRAILDSALPEPVRKQLDRIAQRFSGQRQLLIRQGHEWSTRVRCFLAETRESGSGLRRIELTGYDELEDFDPAARSTDGALSEPLLLVCTHGTRDKCCAKFGRPVYASLRSHAPDRVWECTHVGGDRFAGNVVCLPEGIYYGHVEPEDATTLLATLARGEIWLEKYRGRSCYPRAGQVGEYFVRRETGLKRIDDLRLLSIDRNSDGWQVRFSAAREEMIYEVEFRTSERWICQPLTCKSATADSIRQYELVRFYCDQGGTTPTLRA
jgi:hypothetical protein